MLAFSVWNALWVVFVTFLFISVLMMFFNVVVDLFRDRELNGVSKTIWVLVLLFLPLIGLLIYVIARGDGMAARQIQAQVDARESFDAYVREVSGGAGTGGAASELEKAAAMHAGGQLSDEEFAALKRKILG